jgi:lipopolysaccharide biosynthesis glycosyltransferase
VGVEPTEYFNSGVLVFDLDHRDVGEALDRSVVFADQQPDRITFFDQCALNVGFAGRWTPLPSLFNFYVPPDLPSIKYPKPGPDEPVVRHYVQPPKPWDPAYEGENNRAWRIGLASLKEVLDGDELRLLLRMAIRTGSRTPA